MARKPQQTSTSSAAETKMKTIDDNGRTQAYEHVRIECPSCGKEPNCYKTVRLSAKIRRYYKCGWCGRVFKTIEANI